MRNPAWLCAFLLLMAAPLPAQLDPGGGVPIQGGGPMAMEDSSSGAVPSIPEPAAAPAPKAKRRRVKKARKARRVKAPAPSVSGGTPAESDAPPAAAAKKKAAQAPAKKGPPPPAVPLTPVTPENP